MAECVALRPILEVCDRETGYEGGGTIREPWWSQTAARKQLSATFKDISAVARDHCCKLGRRGKSGGGDMGAEESEYGAGRYGYWYNGMETEEAQVGE